MSSRPASSLTGSSSRQAISSNCLKIMEERKDQFWLLASEGKLVDLQDLLDKQRRTDAAENQDSESALVNWKRAVCDESTPLIVATWGGHCDVVKWLLETTKVNVDDKDNYGFSSLLWAGRYGYAEMIPLLLNHGAMIDERTKEGDTALIWAAINGHEQTVQVLIERGAGIHVRNNIGETAIHWASRNDHLEVVRKLIQAGANVEDRDDRQGTCLLYTCRQGNGEVAKELLKHGAGNSVDAQDADGETALSFAATNGYWMIAQTLLDNGANVDIKNGKGYTALHSSASNGNDGFIQCIVDCGANVSAPAPDGCTGLLLGAKEGHFKVVRKLLFHGAELTINAQDDEFGNTALMWAAKNDHKESLEPLLDHNADMSIKNKEGKTALDIATEEARGVLTTYSPQAKDCEDLWNRIQCKERELFGEIWYRNFRAAYNAHVDKKEIAAWLRKVGDLSEDIIGQMLAHADHGGNNVGLYAFALVMRLVSMVEQSEPLSIDVVMNVQRRLLPQHPGFSVNLSHTKAFSKHSSYGRTNQLKELFAAYGSEINVNWRNPSAYDCIPLIDAAFSGSEETVIWMLENLDVHVNEKNSNGNTPLHCACHKERITVILLDHGANINDRNNLGESAMMRAARWGYDKVVQALLDRGADASIKDIEGKTAFERAMTNKHQGTAICLYSHMEKAGILQTGQPDFYSRMVNTYASDGKLTDLRKVVEQHKAEIDFNWRNSDDLENTAVIRAATHGHHEIVRYILASSDADANHKAQSDWTALHYAARQGFDKVTQVLLRFGADPNQKNNDGWTPLHLAAFNGRARMVQMFLDHGGDRKIKDGNGQLPIDAAADKGRSECVELLLDSSFSAHGRVFFGYANSGLLDLLKEFFERHQSKIRVNSRNPDMMENTALIAAVVEGHLDVVTWLLDVAKVNVNDFNKDRNAALHAAVWKGDPKIVQALFDHNAKLDIRNKNGETPTLLAAYHGNDEILEMLLQRGANFQIKDNLSTAPLDVAAEQNNGLCVDLLLTYTLAGHNEEHTAYKLAVNQVFYGYAAGNHLKSLKTFYEHHKERIDTNLRNPDERYRKTPLISAAAMGNAKVVSWLLEDTDADVHRTSGDGCTALQFAAEFGHEAVVSILLDHGAQVDDQSENGWTALLWAACKGDLAIVKMLVQRGASINIQTPTGVSPLTRALDQGHAKVVKALLLFGADPNLRDTAGDTVLHEAVGSEKGRKLIPAILAHGANPRLTNKKGATPMAVAVQRKSRVAKRHLLRNEADTMPVNFVHFA